jgi:hypothetical protein
VLIVRRFILILAVPGLFAAGTFASAASASPWNRSCGSSRDGFLTQDNQMEVLGPWQVGMSYGTAKRIDQRVGIFEGWHISTKDVPCVVAENVAWYGADAWTRHWSGDDGWMGAGWIGAANGPYYGAFHCTGVPWGATGNRETCHHRADRHAGAITVRFVIRPVS